MSNVKRYGFPWLECDATDEAYMQDNGMTELKDGGFVLWADYARLKTEMESLKEAWVDKKMQEDRDALLQEVERLHNELGLMEQMFEKYLTPEVRKAIVKAAKEGKQS